MSNGASYGFKLAGITIPDDTTSINVVISDGTTPTEYTLTGSVADGFSGTGASATAPGELKLDDDAAVITANSVYYINAEVSAWFEDLTLEELKRNDIYVNGIRLPYDEEEGIYLYIDGDIAYVVVPSREEGQTIATFEAVTVSTSESVPGTYHLVIYDGSATFNLKIDAFTADDVGDSYNVNVYATKVTQSFKTAVEMVLEESGGSKPILDLYVASNDANLNVGEFESESGASVISILVPLAALYTDKERTHQLTSYSVPVNSIIRLNMLRTAGDITYISSIYYLLDIVPGGPNGEYISSAHHTSVSYETTSPTTVTMSFVVITAELYEG